MDDLVDFDTETMKTVSGNVRRPRIRILYPDASTASGETTPTLSFVLVTKSQMGFAPAQDFA